MESSAETPIIQRLNEFIRYTGLSSTQFADKAGIPRPTLSQMVHGRNKSVNNQMLAKLNENFPELNILWFLFGQGTMLLDNRSPLAGSETSGSEVHEVVDNEFVTLWSNLYLRRATKHQRPIKCQRRRNLWRTEVGGTPQCFARLQLQLVATRLRKSSR